MLPRTYAELATTEPYCKKVPYVVRKVFGVEDSDIIQHVWVRLIEAKVLERALEATTTKEQFLAFFSMSVFRFTSNCARTRHRERCRVRYLENALRTYPTACRPDGEESLDFVRHAEAFLQGLREKKYDTRKARSLLAKGYSLRDVAKALDLPASLSKLARCPAEAKPVQWDIKYSAHPVIEYKLPSKGVKESKVNPKGVLLSGREAALHLEMQWQQFKIMVYRGLSLDPSKDFLAPQRFILRPVVGTYAAKTAMYRLSDIERLDRELRRRKPVNLSALV